MFKKTAAARITKLDIKCPTMIPGHSINFGVEIHNVKGQCNEAQKVPAWGFALSWVLVSYSCFSAMSRTVHIAATELDWAKQTCSSQLWTCSGLVRFSPVPSWQCKQAFKLLYIRTYCWCTASYHQLTWRSRCRTYYNWRAWWVLPSTETEKRTPGLLHRPTPEHRNRTR